MPIYDLLGLYKNNYKDISFIDSLFTYEGYIPFLEEERYLFFSEILKPPKIEFNSSEVINTKKTYEIIVFLQNSSDIISKYHPSDTNSKNSQKE